MFGLGRAADSWTPAAQPPIPLASKRGTAVLEMRATPNDAPTEAVRRVGAAIAAHHARQPTPHGLTVLFGSYADPQAPDRLVAGLLVLGNGAAGPVLVAVLDRTDRTEPPLSWRDLYAAPPTARVTARNSSEPETLIDALKATTLHHQHGASAPATLRRV